MASHVKYAKMLNNSTSLDLSDNDIGVEGATILTKALDVNSTLTSLNLGYNNIEIELTKRLEYLLSKKGLIIRRRKESLIQKVARVIREHKLSVDSLPKIIQEQI